MKKLLTFLLAAVLVASANNAWAETWDVRSPNHSQTFSYGSEKHRQWLLLGTHLGIYMEFTNDPYVDRTEPRQYDSFIFEFPSISLGPDERTFYYRATDGSSVAVAKRNVGSLFSSVSLLPSSHLEIKKTHGVLDLTLLITDEHSIAADGNSVAAIAPH